MRLKLFAFIWFAALAAAPITLSADEGCCDKPAAACCDKPAQACCDKPATNTAPASGDCCQKAEKHNHDSTDGCCKTGEGCEMPCCKDGGTCAMPCCQQKGDQNLIELFFEMDGQAVQTPIDNTAGSRQTAVVYFHRPVWVGRHVLMGKHIIEHDTDRQARGEPCTHIYAAHDPRTPVAVFHCTHLEGEHVDRGTVVLQSLGDGSQRLLRFQFKGETAAHEYWTGR